jgi:hypothetical protein
MSLQLSFGYSELTVTLEEDTLLESSNQVRHFVSNDHRA